MTAGLLGVCNELLGNMGAAEGCYSRGLQANPDNEGLLVARGILLYGSGPRAIADLERAVQLRAPVVWPYLFLAHHYLITSRFGLCRAICETGLATRGSETALSQLEEWRAIAQAELGFPSESVKAAFEAAIRRDPSNEFAKRNRDAFEASIKSPRAGLVLNWERKTESAIRQLGMAERWYPLAA
jgi:tetratricopeptide (TPR) repeat protein